MEDLKSISQETNSPIIYDSHIETAFILDGKSMYFMPHPEKDAKFFV